VIDYRRETTGMRVFRIVWFAALAITTVVLLQRAAALFGDPTSAIWRYRSSPVEPRVFARGTLWRATNDGGLAALCSVRYERFQQCGRDCWKPVDSLTSSHARLDVEWSSSPLPAHVGMSSKFRFEPRPPSDVIPRVATSKLWQRVANDSGARFGGASMSSSERIVEACLDSGEHVFVEACFSTSSNQLEPCAGLPFYGVIAGEPANAIDASADDIALRVAGAFFALLVGLLGVATKGSPLAAGLEDRAAPHRRKIGVARALLGVPPVAVFIQFLFHASPPTSTWATGRLGFACGIGALALWLLFALSRAIHRSRTLAALGPVLATPRSLLAAASGTAELAVRARLRGAGLKPFIGDDVVAFSELKITETYLSGKNTRSIERLVFRGSDELEVVDESGDGVLDLSHAILDVETRKVSLPELSPRYAERGITLDRQINHLTYKIEERVIRAGEPLYVFGDVSGIALKASEEGYRSVRGSPTLGGTDVAPVLVHAGDERGLVASLAVEARAANSMVVIAACASFSLTALLVYLASL
jgi:hypothetical protein